MRSSRPVSLTLNPFKFSWPFTALASITHRLTGVALFVALLGGLYLLQLALSSPAGFAQAAELAVAGAVRFFIFLVLLALVYHLFAGIKHILLDLHIGDSYAAAKGASILVFVLTLASIVPLGMWLW